MTQYIAPAQEYLEKIGKLQRRIAELEYDGILHAYDIDNMPIPCPRCGRLKMTTHIHHGALSRHADVYICADCGIDEALIAFEGYDPLPAEDWAACGQYVSKLMLEGEKQNAADIN